MVRAETQCRGEEEDATEQGVARQAAHRSGVPAGLRDEGDPRDSGDAAADDHRPLAAEAPPAAVADELMLLPDGAMVAGHLGDPAAAGGSFLRACRAVIRPRG